MSALDDLLAAAERRARELATPSSMPPWLSLSIDFGTVELPGEPRRERWWIRGAGIYVRADGPTLDAAVAEALRQLDERVG